MPIKLIFPCRINQTADNAVTIETKPVSSPILDPDGISHVAPWLGEAEVEKLALDAIAYIQLEGIRRGIIIAP